jgi:hypothetical protein
VAGGIRAAAHRAGLGCAHWFGLGAGSTLCRAAGLQPHGVRRALRSQYNCVVVSNRSTEQQMQINDLCREAKTMFYRYPACTVRVHVAIATWHVRPPCSMGHAGDLWISQGALYSCDVFGMCGVIFAGR